MNRCSLEVLKLDEIKFRLITTRSISVKSMNKEIIRLSTTKEVFQITIEKFNNSKQFEYSIKQNTTIKKNTVKYNVQAGITIVARLCSGD